MFSSGLNGHTSAATNGIATCFGILVGIAVAPWIYDGVFSTLLPHLVPLYGHQLGEIAAWLIVIILTYLSFFGTKAGLLFGLKMIGAAFALFIA